MKTLIISAFPGCGKSVVYMLLKNKIKILDSDSHILAKNDFPQKYIESIKNNIGKYDIIFISSHELVLNKLKEENIKFNIIYPSKERKTEFIKNYKERGDNNNFINYMNNNFNRIIDIIENEIINGEKIILNEENEFILNNKWFNEKIKDYE